MTRKWLLILFLTFMARPAHTPLARHRALYIWNVGQGQWLTFEDSNLCWHFDMGGESFNWRKVWRLCKHKKAEVIDITHTDWDHVSFARRYLSATPNPVYSGNSTSHRYLAKYQPAHLQIGKLTNTQHFHRNIFPHTVYRGAQSPRRKNASSQVFWIKKVLIPGDSEKSQEKIWSQHRNPLVQTQVLVLGHHGSNTSTSEVLLKRLPQLRQAIASARYARYRHPHFRVRNRLKNRGVALISTEDYGNIRIEISSDKPDTQDPNL